MFGLVHQGGVIPSLCLLKSTELSPVQSCVYELDGDTAACKIHDGNVVYMRDLFYDHFF